MKKLKQEYFEIIESTQVDQYGRPYNQTEHGRIYCSKKSKYHYSIDN